MKCFNTKCQNYKEDRMDNTNCSLYSVDQIQHNECPRYKPEPAKAPTFNVGDTVVCVEKAHCRGLTEGKRYHVSALSCEGWPIITDDDGDVEAWKPSRFKLAEKEKTMYELKIKGKEEKKEFVELELEKRANGRVSVKAGDWYIVTITQDGKIYRHTGVGRGGFFVVDDSGRVVIE